MRSSEGGSRVNAKDVGAVCVVGLLMVSVLAIVVPEDARAGSIVSPASGPAGPWLDEIVWSEEFVRSVALDRIIAGEQDLAMYDLTVLADKQRALAAPEVRSTSAYTLFDEMSINPVERDQFQGFPRNPFAIRAVREAMQYLIDRDYVVSNLFGGFGIPYQTTWHPMSPDYGRNIANLRVLEYRYAYNPGRGQQQMFDALTAAGWYVDTDNFWHDPQGRLVTVKILERTQDERLQMGTYYGDILRGLNFSVQEIGVTNAGIPYGTAPEEDRWSLYTAGWIQTGFPAWDDGRLQFFAACGIGEPYCVPGDPTYYDPPDELEDIANRLALAQYASFAEREQLVARGTELAMQESLRIFIDARESLYVQNVRVDDVVWGPNNDWTLKAATVPVDPVTGLRTARALNLFALVDGWNPWVFPGWLYDANMRRAMMDPAMARHPHTGQFVNYRANATVTTAGPAGTLPVPSDAVIFDTTANAWQPVGVGIQAISAVSYDMNFGNWHHGVNITMDDVTYTWSNLWRRAFGDIGQVPGIQNAASPAEEYFVQNVLKGIRVVDVDTIEVYLDYWHVDDQEIAGYGALFPSAPWEVQEIAAKLILDMVAANHDGDAGNTGRIWLDLTKGASLPYLGTAVTDYASASHIPPGMSGDITVAEADARWTALASWSSTYGHYWPSNGPFYLDLVDETNRQVVMKAFRTGYPFDADYWKSVATPRTPTVQIGTVPVVVRGSAATIPVTTSLLGQPYDRVALTYLIVNTTAGQVLLTGQPVATGNPGEWEVQLSGAQTSSLSVGTYVLEVVGVGEEASTPAKDSAPLDVIDLSMPDYVIAGVNAPSPVPRGSTNSVAVDVRNDGDSAGSVDVTLAAFEGGSPTPFFTATVPSLAVSEVFPVDVTWIAPAIPGIVNLRFVVDSESVLSEFDETNNEAVTAVVVEGIPDYGLEGVTAPPKASVGTGVTVSLSVRNLGDGDGSVDTTLAAFEGASPTPFFTVTVAPLAASESNVVTIDWTSPSVMGAVTLRFVVDSADALAESDETNNEASAIIDVRDGPLTTIAWQGANATTSRLFVRSTTTFTLQAQDRSDEGATAWYRIDGGAATEYAQAVSLPTEGDHTIEYWGEDGLGGVEAVHSLAVTVDDTPPATTPTVGSPEGDRTTVTLSASDPGVGLAKIEYSVDGGAWQEYDGPVVVPGYGSHTISFRATDSLGNEEMAGSRAWTVPEPVSPLLIGLPILLIALTAIGLLLWRRRSKGRESPPASEEPK